MSAIMVLLGAAAWSLLEYLLHRFLGHDRRTQPNFFSREHTRHHSEGDYFAPSWKKLVFAGLVALALVPLAGVAFTVGFAALYLVYEWLHRREHTHPGIGRYGRYLRRHHFHHHFSDPRTNHGVTSPVWDWVFGTYAAPEKTRVPAKLAMRWLRDPATGVVHPRFSSHYEIRC